MILVGGYLVLAVIVLVFLAIGAIVAVQAAWRGYGFVVWIVAATLGNPVFLLILLGVLPDRKRRRQRAAELADIRSRVAARPRRVAAPTRPPDAPRDVSRSVGDGETNLPDRSIGDEETRG